ncbi:MAG: flagellar basal body P-ring formation protein FlgA [Hyphomicrobiaceae bacterium]|nr:flagellar basal body P-ring formation protein FlgA [Hyphomicrobiaceae bacterium]
MDRDLRGRGEKRGKPTSHAGSRRVPHGLSISLAAALGFAVLAAAMPVRAAGLPLPVPRITLYPGDAIRADHLVDKVFDANLPGRSAVLQTREDLVGKVARRTLLPGQPIPVNALREPYLVVQGRTVLVVLEADGLIITGYAVALQSGGLGDVISLRNIDSGSGIKGAVQPDGSVRVSDP